MKDLEKYLNEMRKPGDSVYETLKKAIHSGYFAPGERLIEAALSNGLNVGRTPIREAFKKLEMERLIKIAPNKGATVIKLSPEEIGEIYMIGGILEGKAAFFATERLKGEHIEKLKGLNKKFEDEELQKDYPRFATINYEFHKIYLKECEKPILFRKIRETLNSLPRYWYMCCSLPRLIDISIIQHKELTTAFENKDAELARRIAEDHVVDIGQILKEHLEALPNII